MYICRLYGLFKNDKPYEKCLKCNWLKIKKKVVKIDFTNILNKALGISKGAKFKVKEFNENQIGSVESKELSYLQLGTILIESQSEIKEVHIIYKE